MTREEALAVRVGDTVIPDPMWNATTGARHKRLPAGVTVLGTIERKSQTGVLLQVETIGKDKIWIDAGWFALPERSS